MVASKYGDWNWKILDGNKIVFRKIEGYWPAVQALVDRLGGWQIKFLVFKL